MRVECVTVRHRQDSVVGTSEVLRLRNAAATHCVASLTHQPINPSTQGKRHLRSSSSLSLLPPLPLEMLLLLHCSAQPSPPRADTLGNFFTQMFSGKAKSSRWLVDTQRCSPSRDASLSLHRCSRTASRQQQHKHTDN